MIRRALPLLLVVFIAASALGADRLDPRAATFPTPVFTPPAPLQSALPSGANLFLAEDHDIGLVRLWFTFIGGSLYDPEGLEGLSEITGAAWRTGGTAGLSPEKFDEALEARGIELNLSLGRETGMASLSLLPRDLEVGLDLLAELLFSPAFDAGRFHLAVADKKDAIRREADDPDALAFRQMRKTLYAGHPRSRQATLASVGAVKLADAVNLHKELLASSAWVVGAVGDFNPATLTEALKKRFGSLSGERGARFAPLPAPKPITPAIVFVPKKLNQTTVVWASLAPGLTSPERAPLDIADFILGGSGFQSRLMRKIRIEKGLAYSVSSFYSPLEEFGVVGASGATATANAGELFRLLSSELKVAGEAGFSQKEIEDAKATEANRFIFRYRDPADQVAERMVLTIKGLPSDLVASHFAALKEVTPESAKGAAGAWFKPGEGVWVVVGEVDQADPVFDGPRRKFLAGED